MYHERQAAGARVSSRRSQYITIRSLPPPETYVVPFYTAYRACVYTARLLEITLNII